jgi:hypothetical protein
VGAYEFNLKRYASKVLLIPQSLHQRRVAPYLPGLGVIKDQTGVSYSLADSREL